MSLISGDEAHFGGVDHCNEAFIIETFGRYIAMDSQHASPQASTSDPDLRLRGIRK